MEYKEHNNAELIREDGQTGIQVYELTPDDGPSRKHRFYVVERSGNQVKSVVPNDMPADSGTWFANGFSAGSIGYVAGGRTRKNAMYWFRRCVAEIAEYMNTIG